MISAGCSRTLAQVHAAQSTPSAALRTFHSQLLVLLLIPNLSLLLLLLLLLLLQLLLLQLHLLLPLLLTILSTCMEISAQSAKIILFAVRTATTVINLTPSQTLSNGTLLMPPADAFLTSVLLKAIPTLILSIPIIMMVSAMAAMAAMNAA